MSDNSATGTEADPTCYEWGYRLPNGQVEWEVDHGTDGTWTSWLPEYGIEAVDIYLGSEFKAIRSALDKAGQVGAVVIRRPVLVSRGPAEEIFSE